MSENEYSDVLSEMTSVAHNVMAQEIGSELNKDRDFWKSIENLSKEERNKRIGEVLEQKERPYRRGYEAGTNDQYDNLTGLPLRATLEHRLKMMLSWFENIPEEKNKETLFSVIITDGNAVKTSNEVLTRFVTDDLLRLTGGEFINSFREGDLVCRGGEGADENIAIVINGKVGRRIEGRVWSFEKLVEEKIVNRIIKGNDKARNEFFSTEKVAKRMKKAGVDLGLKGVGTLAVGIRYFSVEEVREMINKWNRLSDDDRKNSSFSETYLFKKVEKIQREAKIQSKSGSLDKMNNFVYVSGPGSEMDYREIELS